MLVALKRVIAGNETYACCEGQLYMLGHELWI